MPKISVFLLSCFSITPLFSQPNPTVTSSLIDGMALLRHDAMKHDSLGILELIDLDKRFITSPEGVPIIREGDVEILQKKVTDLVDLINMDILINKPPFRINPNCPLFTEIQEYNLQSGMKVGEIGAGTGIVSFLMGAAFRDLTIYVNEVDPDLITRLKKKQKRTSCIDASNRLHVVKGNSRNTHLEGKHLDLLIIRNTLHHFSNKKAMLASIKKTLRPDGTVILVETLRNLNSVSCPCPRAMSESEIIHLMEQHGFLKVSQQVVGVQSLYKFKIANE